MEQKKITHSKFNGDKKLPMNSPLAGIEKKMVDGLVSKFPKWIEGYHLTLATILWSIGLIAAGYLARFNMSWLWLSSAMFIMQWFTDCFDGALGRHRDTGIPKWGFYMDHLLDYVFLCSAFIGYSFLLDGFARHLLLICAPVFTAFMANSFLSFGATGEFKITFLGMGPTEMRIGFIIVNLLIILFGTSVADMVLPCVLAVALLFLGIVVFRTQRYIWHMEMNAKQSKIGKRG